MKKTFPILFSIALAAFISSCDDLSSPLPGSSIATNDLVGRWILTGSDSFDGCSYSDTTWISFLQNGSMSGYSNSLNACNREAPVVSHDYSDGTWSISHDTIFTIQSIVNATIRDTVRFHVKGSVLYLESRDDLGRLTNFKLIRDKSFDSNKPI